MTVNNKNIQYVLYTYYMLYYELFTYFISL